MRAVDNLRAGVGFAVSPHRALMDIHRRFGPVCTLGVGPAASVFLLGPEANQFVLGNSQLFRWREAFDSLVVVDGETALIVSDGPDHQRRRRLVTRAFTRGRIERYADTIRANVDAAIDGWRPGRILDLHLELRRVIRRSTIEVLFGPRLARDEPELGRLLEMAMIPVERLPPWQQLQRRGWPSWRRAVESRAAVARRVAEEIAHRREIAGPGEIAGPDETPGPGETAGSADAAGLAETPGLAETAGSAETDTDRPDVLNLLVGARDEDGSGLTDVEIIDQVISLIAAGYETTSAAMASAMYAMLSDPYVWSVAAESVRGGPGARGTQGDQAWRYVDGVVSETLRLYPPGAISARGVAEPFTFMGTDVKVGQTVIFSPYVTHRLPQLWPDPLRFRPERWDPSRPGFTRPGPHEFLPFGGGTHRCLGAAFAVSEITVLLEALLRRTTLRLDAVDPRPVGLAAMRPRRGPLAEVLTVS
ncbi:MAG TPA: cytochrome P450 [Pseudonocardia sp.]|nr:cytochrome P450 [Pseudonocardia sp.]